jgi:acetyl-CoA carboxylase biotin carboxyl carrier protein
VTLTARDVAAITRLLEESDFDELHLELDGLKLTLRRGSAATSRAVPAPAGTPAPEGPAPATARAAAAVGENVYEVAAPMLGTFYRAPKPGAPPFVEVGSQVEDDTIVCIIEVMKLMHTVRAAVRGRVTEILGRDGALVEYGETLLRVERAGEP